MRKVSTLTLALVLTFSSFLAIGCGGVSSKHKLAIYTANADAALVALTDATDRLHQAGRVSQASAKSVYGINLKVVGAIELIRDRAKSGYEKKDLLFILTSTIDDLRKAEADGVLGLAGKERDQFLKITFFAQFALKSVQAVIEATKEPTVPMDQMTEVLAVKATRSTRAADDSVWTDLVLILQNAVVKGISQSRLSEAEAFADGALLSSQLRDSLNQKLLALG